MLFEFVFIVLAVALGIILGMGVLFILIMSPKVMAWYMNKTQEMVMKSFDQMQYLTRGRFSRNYYVFFFYDLLYLGRSRRLKRMSRENNHFFYEINID